MKTIVYAVFMSACLSIAGPVFAQSSTPSSSVAADTMALKNYVGTYVFDSSSPVQKFTVTTEKGDLFGEADSFGKNKLLKQTKSDTYKSTSSYGSTITFVRDATTKAVKGLTLAAQGTELSAKKDNP